ncbi:MAG: hypothetical protein AAF514_19245, partial [Verrucomicrobiota bacterium]
MKRRSFLKASAAGSLVLPHLSHARESFVSETFGRPDSLVHGPEWESLNPGFWQIKDGALRRRLKNYGDRARRTGFPYHYETHQKRKMETEYDPSLSHGILWRRDWKLEGNFTVKIEGTIKAEAPEVPEGDQPEWRMHQPGYGMIGIAFGGRSLLEGYGRDRHATIVGWTDDNRLSVIREGGKKARKKGGKDEGTSPEFERLELAPEDTFTIGLEVREKTAGAATITVTLTSGDRTAMLVREMPRSRVRGFIGIACRGLLDVEVDRFDLEPGNNAPLKPGHADCCACYPLGDSLKEVDGHWKVKFVGVFASDGEEVQIRVADSERPTGGWQNLKVAGSAAIVDNAFRRNTAVVDVTLPRNPADTTLYYTVWKDGVEVTADPRIGTDACGPGTGLVGDVPASGGYVGRLPRLKAPYKLCGLSCHAITSGLQKRTDSGWNMVGGGDDWQFRDQPTVEAYKHLEDYGFQVMVWEDDVWYMELVLYPPSADDAYKQIAHSIFGPTTRWQMMRHWNVINPGDHDYGMDDVKGPEQIAIRKHDGLGQDASYMRRNFQIVHHLITGEEEVDPLANPKKWRAWKMPNRDFTFAILDSRLWR